MDVRTLHPTKTNIDMKVLHKRSSRVVSIRDQRVYSLLFLRVPISLILSVLGALLSKSSGPIWLSEVHAKWSNTSVSMLQAEFWCAHVSFEMIYKPRSEL